MLLDSFGIIMDHQSMPGGGAGAVQEFCYVGAGQPEIAGGAFLLELLEDTPAPADQPMEVIDDRLSCVMRSLEAEIGSGPALGPATAEGSESMADGLMSDDGGLEDMLSDFYSNLDAEAPFLMAVPFEYWVEATPAVMGNDMGDWYVDGEGIVAGYEFREPCYYTYGEGSAAGQVYSPLYLWE